MQLFPLNISLSVANVFLFITQKTHMPEKWTLHNYEAKPNQPINSVFNTSSTNTNNTNEMLYMGAHKR